MRKYVRHPSDIPIEFDVKDMMWDGRDCMNNVSLGGLSFKSHNEVGVGTTVAIRIRVVKPPFEAAARVTWCERTGDLFDVGVAFTDQEDLYRMRMVEQVCYIEQYKKDVLRKEGRDLSGEEAALEWISKYAREFPSMGLDS